MKKRLSAIVLSLALCLGLAVPAFAAEKEKNPVPSLSISLPDGYTAQEKTDTYQVRRLTCETVEEPKETFVYTRSVYSYSEEASAEELTVTPIPLGATIRINDPYGASIDVSAWSDPDGDGIYHERIFSYEISTAYSCNIYSLLPLGDGPYDASKISDGCSTSATAEDAGFWQAGIANDPMFTTSDALYKLYGPNTIIKVTATPYQSDTVELGCFLLTGEVAPPAITMNVFNPDSTIPDKDMEFTLRSITETFHADNRLSAMYTEFTRNGETEPLKLKDVPSLDVKGVVQIRGIEAVVDTQKPWDRINLSAWSDPDGDGVYDQQLFTYYWATDSVTMVPLSKQGPFTFHEIDYNEGKPIYSRSMNLTSEGELTSRSYGYSGETPSSILLNNNYLTWLFGPDTLVKLQAVTAEKTEGPAFYCYIPKDAAAIPAFNDVPTWCWDAVDWAAKNGITTGTSYHKFSPATTCTNVQILTFLWRAENKPTSTATVFSSLAGDYAPAANWAYEKKLIDDSFNPSAPCTRSQAVSYIWQALGKEDAAASSFIDVAADTDYAAAVNWAVANGVTEGVGGNKFSPGTTCTRGQIAAFLQRAYVPEARLNAK